MNKTKLTVYVSEELAEQVRNAVAYLAGNPLYLTMAEMAERALGDEVKRLQKEHNKGKPFPEVKGRRRPGRPVGS